MSMLEGQIEITGLPRHRGLVLTLCFFRVPSADAPAPFGGDPPAEQAVDCEKVFDQVDLDVESDAETFQCPFKVDRPIGHYFVQLRAILFRMQNGKVFAQAEQIFFSRRPISLGEQPHAEISLPVPWPTEALESLHRYGTISPQCKRPWWRFW